MKKIIVSALMVIMLFVFALSCAKKKDVMLAPGDFPTATLTQAIGTITYSPTNTATPTFTSAPADLTLYPFEDGTIMGWNGKFGGTSATANSTAMAYLGTHSLQISGSFTAGANNGVENTTPLITNLTGKNLKLRVWIPADFPAGVAFIFIQSGAGSAYQRGLWKSYNTGSWNELLYESANPDYTNGTPDITNVTKIALCFIPATTYTGYVYMDSLEVISLAPTVTPTYTKTWTVSPTFTVSRTPGGPTETITPTHSVSPTITMTQTTISTPISPAAMGSNVQYYGRWDLTTPSQPSNGWGTTYMVAGFNGTSIALNFTAWDQWLAYAIDGNIADHSSFIKFRVSDQSDPLTPVPTQTVYVIKGLADTNHTIMIVRRTDAAGGSIGFKGFGLDTGKTMTAPVYTPPTRKMEFIGDSITCGSSNEYNLAVPTPDCMWGGCMQNGDQAFGPQLARMYNADYRTISRGGIGIYRNCKPCSPFITMPDVYSLVKWEAAPTGSSPQWNFATWQADVVVIALGTNDFDPTLSPSVPDQTAFESTYSAFLTTLRGYYPNAYILCTQPIPQVYSTWVPALAGTYISNVVAAKGDPKIKYVNFNNPPINSDFPLPASDYAGDNTHPIVSAHTKVANALKTWMDANIAGGLGW